MYWFIEVIKKYALFSGRARRKEYWMFTLYVVIFSTIASLIDIILGTKFGLPEMFIHSLPKIYHNSSVGLINSTLSLFLFVPSLAVTVRRLHDVGKSGYWILIYYIVGIICILLGVTMLILIFLSAVVVGSSVFMIIMSLFGLLGLAILVLALFIIVWTLIDSQPGQNKYGPNPKEVETTTTTTTELTDI